MSTNVNIQVNLFVVISNARLFVCPRPHHSRPKSLTLSIISNYKTKKNFTVPNSTSLLKLLQQCLLLGTQSHGSIFIYSSLVEQRIALLFFFVLAVALE